MRLLALLLCAGLTTFPSIGAPSVTESVRDDGVSRKVLGSSVVTSVSVIMDTGSEKLYADAVGRPQGKPASGAQVASPIDLLNPDRYEFYTFSDSGELVKRLMTLSEIQGIVANADGAAHGAPEKKVDAVVSNVQSVLKAELAKGNATAGDGAVVLDTPDVSASWSVILPAIFGHAPTTPDTPVKVTTFDATTTPVATPKPTTPFEPVDDDEDANVLERVKHTTTTTSSASSQFAQLFDLGQGQGEEASSSPRLPEGALFIVDEKTNTRTPITTKEQLTSLLNKFDVGTSTASMLEESSITLNTSVTKTEPPPGLDLDKYQQLLLTSTNIYEINKELAKSTTTSTPKEPNLVDSIEQLIQQAVGNIQAVAGKTTTTTEEVATTESAPTTQFASTLPDDFLLNEAVGSLLSQVVGADFQGLTTPQDLSATTDEQLEYRAKTTDIFSETTTIATNLNEILKTDATSYDLSERQTTTDAPPDVTTDSPRTTEEVVVKDLPVVYLEGEETTTEQPEALTISPTEENLVKVELEMTTVVNQQKNVSDNETDGPSDSDSLPSTNSYKEITGNAFEKLDAVQFDGADDADTLERFEASTASTQADNDSSTLSIEELIKELTTRDQSQGQRGSQSYSDAVPKETTVLIITKPLYTTSAPTTTESTWTIVSTISPTDPEANKTAPSEFKLPPVPGPVELTPMPQLGGLEDTTKQLEPSIQQFVALCNELAFGFWQSVTSGISSARSVVLSPFAATSLLAMVFLGARGATSGEMNEILRLDDMATFNPHLIFKNVSESVAVARPTQGVATSVILRELYSDRAKGHLLNFYKERAKAFYDGHVEEASFKEIGDVIRRRTNLIVRKLTDGKIPEYVKDGGIDVRRPLAAISASIFQTDCSKASSEGRDGELHFVVLPSIRQRRLVPIPAVVWRSDFLAGYDPLLDATAVSLGGKDTTIATIFVVPGQQGVAAPGDGLARLETSLLHTPFKNKAWSRLLATLLPRPGLELHVPRFQHRSVINATGALQQMGMRDLFDAAKADLRGLNGVANDLYLSDVLQLNSFATCGERASHHAEIYPATAKRRKSRRSRVDHRHDEMVSDEPRDYQRAFHDPLHDPALYALPLPLRPRQARLPDAPRLRLDRPFLYFVRHNPTGLILHMGRFNPRLLP